MQNALAHSDAHGRTDAGSWLVAVSALLLSGLAVTDRTIAWMIGQFPTSADLWELRFEYLRPIGVFYDIAVQNVGSVGVGSFNLIAVVAALAVGLGALSRVRLARALSSHAVLTAALVVAVYSVDPGEGVYAPVGVPSKAYMLIGLLLTIAASFMCASVHCEYMGWHPASSRAVRGAKLWLGRLSSRLSDRFAEAFEEAFPTIAKSQAILVRTRRPTRPGLSR